MSDNNRAAELERLNKKQRVKRYRLRQAGVLPPLPRCAECGCRVLTDRWPPSCATCAGGRGAWGARQGHQARPLRLMAEQIICEIREAE